MTLVNNVYTRDLLPTPLSFYVLKPQVHPETYFSRFSEIATLFTSYLKLF